MSVTYHDVSEKDFGHVLSKIELSLREKHMKLALKAAGKVVVNKAKSLVPRSVQTGSRKKNSKAYKQKFGDPPKPLHKTIGQLSRSYKDGIVKVEVVGAMRPAGAHGHLVENGHDMVLWGRGYSATREKVTRSDEEFKALKQAQIGKRGRRVSRSITVTNVKGGIQGFVAAKKWLAPSVDSTRQQQDAEVVRVLTQAMNTESK